MKFNIPMLALLLVGILSCKTQKKIAIYKSDQLQIEKLTDHTFRHVTYLQTNDFGKVECNGMIVIDNGEALIFDTPSNDKDSKELIDWVSRDLKCKVVGIVVTHFHGDCLGGLNEFHHQNIPSYSTFKTMKLAKGDGKVVPQKGFEKYLAIKVGTKEVQNEFLGEGHTKDNIVSYFPDENVLFGGCLVKELGASKGYLGDANLDEWSNTIAAVKSKYGNARIIIPGHGKPGNTDLLDYTRDLFKKK